MKIRPIMTLAVTACAVATALADAASDARSLLESGDAAAAYEAAAAAISSTPASKSGPLYLLQGEAAIELGDFAAAREALAKAKAKNETEAYRLLGKLAYMDYDFETATGLYGQYRKLRSRAKKPLTEEAETEIRQIQKAEEMLERVEKIAVIDSITVDYDTFFKAYRLPSSAGRISAPGQLPFEESRGMATTVFSNEQGDAMLWAEPDTTGTNRIMETLRLTDGTWQLPAALDETLNGGGDADYPFLMPDGVTLYFASDGEDSIGGYDIFVSTRDASDGSFLQPQNLGMPYNSPADDFMLAIDEENGVGWWATDRNHIPGKLTVYLFATNDMRVNYDTEETDGIENYARISDIKATQDPETDYSELLATVRAINPDAIVRKADFHFPVGSGREYTTLSDFPDDTSRRLMSEYLQAERKLRKHLDSLDAMRREYRSNPSSASRIRSAEQEAETLRKNVSDRLNDVYRSLSR